MRRRSLFGALFGLARADRAVSAAAAPSEAAMAALRAEMKEIAVAELRLAEAERKAALAKRAFTFWRSTSTELISLEPRSPPPAGLSARTPAPVRGGGA